VSVSELTTTDSGLTHLLHDLHQMAAHT